MSASKKHSTKKQSVRKPATRVQYGALPYRENKATGLELLLVTSRETRRWIIPKGWPIRGLSPSKSAAREAYEEAGVRGVIRNKPIGRYVYGKMLNERTIAIPCEVRVFVLQVRRQENAWPEYKQREARWFSVSGAIEAVTDSKLKTLIAAFASSRKR